MDEIKKVHTTMDQQLWESESEMRRDIDQVARELQEVSQTTETFMRQVSSQLEQVPAGNQRPRSQSPPAARTGPADVPQHDPEQMSKTASNVKTVCQLVF